MPAHVAYPFEEVLDDRSVVGMDEVDDVLAVARAFGIAEHVGRHRAGVAQLAVGIDQRDHVRRAGDQRLQPLLTRADRRVRIDAIGDVARSW